MRMGHDMIPPRPSRTETCAPPRNAGTTLSGWPSISTAVRRTVSPPIAPSRSASASIAPASAAAAEEPRPRFKGIELWIESSADSDSGRRPAVIAARCAASITRLVESGGSRSAPSPDNRAMRRPSPPGGARTIRSNTESAIPTASNPEPRLDVEHGTSTVKGFIAEQPPALLCRRRSASRSRPLRRWRTADPSGHGRSTRRRWSVR